MEYTKNEEKWGNDPVLSKIKFLGNEDLSKVLNVSYLAERFFGKSSSWLYQKLNHSIKNGKPCDFTAEERETLANALDTLAIELEGLADQLHEG